MKEEDFTYCDEVTCEEERIPSAIQRIVDKNLSIRCLSNVYIVPWSETAKDYYGEILDRDGFIVPNVNPLSQYDESLHQQYEIPQDPIVVQEGFYMGALTLCWGHYITDGLAKAWCFEREDVKQLLSIGIPVYYTSMYYVNPSCPIAWKTLLANLNFNTPIESITKPMYFEKLYVPDNSLWHTLKNGRFCTKEYACTIQQIVETANAKVKTIESINMIYLSRLKLKHKNREFGERLIQRAFERAGYKAIYPERLSLEEQIYLFSHADSIATTMGSISHNAVFARQGAKLTIVRKVFYTNDYQYLINQIRGLTTEYIDAHLSVFVTDNPNLGPFFLYCNDNMRRYFADLGITIRDNFSRLCFYIYVLFCIRRENFYKRRYAPEYYYRKMFLELEKHPWWIIKIIKKLIK